MEDNAIDRVLNLTLLMNRAWEQTDYGYGSMTVAKPEFVRAQLPVSKSYSKLIKSLNVRSGKAKELIDKLKYFKEKKEVSKD